MIIKKKIISFVVSLALFVPASLVYSLDNTLDTQKCHIAKTAISDASQIRGLRIKRKVPCIVQDRPAVKDYLLKTVDKKIPPEKIELEEFVYKTFGVIPDSFDYKEGIIELYANMLGGYYDPEKSRFVMAAWLSAELQTPIAVHELTHALQDQYFLLEGFLDEKANNSDMLLARAALVEGDASLVMIDYTKKIMGQKPLREDDNIELFMMQNIVGTALIGGGLKVPESLQLMIIFPYTSGMRFAHHFLRQGGYKKIDKIYAQPPKSTEETIHPEKYGKLNEFIEFKESDLRKTCIPDEANVIHVDVVGEFGISIILNALSKQKLKASQAAAGWGGDLIGVFGKGSRNKTLIWQTHWDTVQDANEFWSLLTEGLKTKFSGTVRTSAGKWHMSARKRNYRVTKLGQDITIEFSKQKLCS